MTANPQQLKRESAAAALLVADFADMLGDDEQARNDLVEGETNLFEALAYADERLQVIEALAYGIDNQMARLKQRSERLKAQHDRIKSMIGAAMAEAQITKAELAGGTISYKDTAPKVEITDESAIPSDYWQRQAPKLDKAGLAKALKALDDGDEIPGARLVRGKTVAIRRD